MDDHEEREIALGLREGKIEAWHSLYEAYAKPVWESVARLLGPGSADVADVVQETFLAAARSAKGYDLARGSLWLWLMGIARNHVAMHFRRQERQERITSAAERLGPQSQRVLRWLEDGQESPPAALASAEVAELVRAALMQLPEDYEAVLTAKYFDGTSVEQLARREKCTATAIRSKLARARRAFHAIFVKAASCSRDGQLRGHHES